MSAGKDLRATTGLMLKLGCLAFGGPAAHIAMLEDEVVERRRWMSRQHFLDLVGATSLIPGPNSTEMMMHVGYERHGWRGLALGGVSFILPAAVITGALAALYRAWGALPELAPLLWGIKPAVLAIILGASWRLGRKAVRTWREAFLGAVVLAAVVAGVNELAALLAGALAGTLFLWMTRRSAGAGMLALPLVAPLAPAALAGGETVPVSLAVLGLFFLKVGAVLYGSGYVLVAFLEGDLVERFGWLTSEQLLDAVAIGQMTPGPVLSTATFIGFLLLGLPGAVVATLAIFLPSFIFVGLLNPLVPRLSGRPATRAFLDAVNVAALGLMAAVVIKLGAATLTSWPAWCVALLAGVGLFGLRLQSAWLVVGGAVLGYLFRVALQTPGLR